MLETSRIAQNEKLIFDLLNGLELGVYTLHLGDTGPVCNAVNHTFCQWAGKNAEQMTGPDNNWLAHVNPVDRQRLVAGYHQVIQTGIRQIVEYRLAEGNITLRDTLKAETDEDGQIIGIIGCVQDISAFKQAQQELERTQLLQAMGRLLAGIAHEINTPVQFIGDNLTFLADAWRVLQQWLDLTQECINEVKDHREVAGRIRHWLEKIEQFKQNADTEFILHEFPAAVQQSLEGVGRVAGLVLAMRDFSHMDERRMAPADLNRAIRSTVTILRNELKYITDVQTDFDPDLPEVFCSVDEMNQVFLNLLINAGHSIQEKIEQGHLQRGCIRIRTRTEDDGIIIRIEDNGAGIRPEIQDRIFERFFTTKRNHPKRHGTGQGLAMVHTIVVQRHEGRIQVDSRPGDGAAFTIYLPLKPVKLREDMEHSKYESSIFG